jgi:hypothetical protein
MRAPTQPANQIAAGMGIATPTPAHGATTPLAPTKSIRGTPAEAIVNVPPIIALVDSVVSRRATVCASPVSINTPEKTTAFALMF